MGSIYEIPSWSAGTASKNEVYLHNSNHFYSLEDSNTQTPAVGASKWGGMTTFDNKEVPHFFWIPSYSPTISTEPSVRTLKFGDGYEQRTQTVLTQTFSKSLSTTIIEMKQKAQQSLTF